jgi:putative oxidoreductase
MSSLGTAVAGPDQIDVGLLVIRVCIGGFLAYHGYNKIFGGGGLSGTAAWFGSIGMKWPKVQARLAAATEICAGVGLAIGLVSPLSAAGVIGIMLVAIAVAHAKVGFFVFLPNQGWEYCATIAIMAWSIGVVGPGRLSVDHALELHFDGWSGAVIASAVGLASAGLLLAVAYRPES